MKIKFIEPSGWELDDAVEYYEDQMPGLGKTFYNEVMANIYRIEQLPSAWQQVGEKTRKCIIKRFPYIVLYIIEDDTLLITAIAHQHRDPEYYLDRII